MKTDKSQDKYTEIFQELREEKMNWDFEDFLAEAEKEETPVIKISEKKSASFPKFYWLAASVVLLASLGFFLKFSNETGISEQDQLVRSEIIKQKEIVNPEIGYAALQQNDSIKTDSIKAETPVTTDAGIMDKILPKRGRIKRNTRPVYVQNSAPEKSAEKNTETAPDYNSSYVIINGQRIEDEQEAIDVAKYSFRILSENVSKTVAQTDVLGDNSDY